MNNNKSKVGNVTTIFRDRHIQFIHKQGVKGSICVSALVPRLNLIKNRSHIHPGHHPVFGR